MPSEEQIKSALLQELYSSPNFSLSAQNAAYTISFGYFTISQEELNVRYSNSRSKWVNRVQVVRNHLVRDGYMLPTRTSGRNVWKLSEKGIVEARRIYLLYNEDDPHPDELLNKSKQDIASAEEEEERFEGKRSFRLSNYYERNPKLRAEAILIHGVVCKVCGFDFELIYGQIGKDFIEVHHLVPISSFDGEHSVNPKSDMTVLCSNCHRMIHRKKNGTILSVKDLIDLIAKKR